MANKSNALSFRAARLTVCSLLLTAWFPFSYAGPGHEHDSDSGHDHSHENAPATEAFYPDEDNAAPAAQSTGKEHSHNDEHDHDHHEGRNDQHVH